MVPCHKVFGLVRVAKSQGVLRRRLARVSHNVPLTAIAVLE